MSAALAYKDDWTEAANSEPPRDRPRLYLAYSRPEAANDAPPNTSGGTRWQYFPAQSDVLNGLFLANLNAIQPANACDAVAAIIASGLSASTGINNGNAGMAVNHPPVIQSNPVANGAAGQAYRYAFLATDPDGDKLTYSIVQGPTGMTMDAVTGVVTWAQPLQGSYNITLRVDDGKAYTDQAYILVIGQGSLQLSLALTITPAVAAASSPVAISVVTMGGQGTVTRSLTQLRGQVLPFAITRKF